MLRPPVPSDGVVNYHDFYNVTDETTDSMKLGEAAFSG